MKVLVKCTFTIEVEVPDNHHDPKFAIEENGCPGTGLVGVAFAKHLEAHESKMTCWACALQAKCEIVSE